MGSTSDAPFPAGLGGSMSAHSAPTPLPCRLGNGLDGAAHAYNAISLSEAAMLACAVVGHSLWVKRRHGGWQGMRGGSWDTAGCSTRELPSTFKSREPRLRWEQLEKWCMESEGLVRKRVPPAQPIETAGRGCTHASTRTSHQAQAHTGTCAPASPPHPPPTPLHQELRTARGEGSQAPHSKGLGLTCGWLCPRPQWCSCPGGERRREERLARLAPCLYGLPETCTPGGEQHRSQVPACLHSRTPPPLPVPGAKAGEGGGMRSERELWWCRYLPLCPLLCHSQHLLCSGHGSILEANIPDFAAATLLCLPPGALRPSC